MSTPAEPSEVPAPHAPAPGWAAWPDERLLQLRFRDLGLRLQGTWVEERVARLHEELGKRGLRFRPHVWLSSDWFSPDEAPGIAVPFYLAHPRLMRLERKQMLEVEGGSRPGCLRLLRHECGHAIQAAYRLHRRRRWQELFGRSSTPYPEFYRPNPASRRFVNHLPLYYAQSHPDEDFAETFAVWLQPRAVWRKRYAGRPALRKLEYVDALMEEIAGRAPAIRSRRKVEPVERLSTTLAAHYAERVARYAPRLPEVYDADLRAIFSDAPAHRHHERASRFLRRNRGRIRRMISRWTHEPPVTLDEVLADMIVRCRELGLRAAGDENELVIDFAMFLTVQTMHFHYSRKNWIPM